jgi:hypothetical protein
METEDDSVSATGTVVSQGKPGSDSTTNKFYLAPNGVTVLCPDASLDDSGMVGGVWYMKRNRDGLRALVGTANEDALVTSCTTGVTDMSNLFVVRAAPSRVSLLLRRCVVVVARPPSPRSEIAAHSPRPPVPRCAVGSLNIQSAHRWMGRELGEEHELHVHGTCSPIPRVAALASPCRRRLSPRPEIAAHSTRPPVPRCDVACLFVQSAHR